MENWLVSASNLYALRAVAAWPLGSAPQLLTLGAMAASIAYHLIERRKHHMPGAVPFADGTLQQHQRFLNLDRASAATLGIYVAALAWRQRRYDLLATGGAALLLNALSEACRLVGVDAYVSAPLQRCWYMLWHCSWHVAAFHLVYALAPQ